MNPFALFRRKPPVPPRATFDLFHLQTGRDNWLAVHNGEVVMAPEKLQDIALIAAVPRNAPQYTVLIAPRGGPISVEGDGFHGPAVTCRLRRVPGGKAELRHPVAVRRQLGVVTGVPVGNPNRVLFDRVGDKLLDRFTLHAAPWQTPLPTGRALLAELEIAFAATLTAERLLALLHAGHVRLTLAEGLARLLPTDEQDALARRLVANPADLALLRRAMPDDPWVSGALPRLLAWCAQGRPATRRTVSPASEDYVAVLQASDLRPQAGTVLHALARRTVSPRRTACVLATARNEGAYLLDWLAHHQACGFDHAVIYSNDNDDGSDELLGLLADHGEITWVRNELSPAARPQWKAYGHAFKMLPDLPDFRWTMVLDIDEYLGFRSDLFASVGDMLGWFETQNTDAVALRWLMFTASRRDTWHDAPSPARFLMREREVSKLYKSLVRSNQFWDSHAHFPFPTVDAPFSYRLEDGSPCHHMMVLKGVKPPDDPVSAEIAWVSHYMFRSAGEALMRASRGDVLWTASSRADTERLDTIVRRFVGMADMPDLVHDDRTLHCAPTLAARLARLQNLPGVRACDTAIKQRFALQIAAAGEAFVGMTVSADRPKEYAQLQNILRAQAEQR